jgi:hypothetical protein
MKKVFLLVIVASLLLTACSWFKGSSTPENSTSGGASGSGQSSSDGEKTQQKVMLPAPTLAPKDRELLRLSRYLEQADAVHREAWWVVASERRAPGKTIFGKVQRGLAQELKLKTPGKASFSCDRYIVKREILSVKGIPQKGQIFESCRSKDSAALLADFEMKTANDAELIFHGQNLGELLGLGTAILNRNIRCQLKGDDEGKLTDLICQDFSQDRNSTESLRFSTYEYHRSGQNLMKLRGQVYEALYATRKFQAVVPLAGKIQVVETQTQAPEAAPAPLISAVIPAMVLPKGLGVLPVDPDSQRRRQLEQNHDGYNIEEMGAPPAGPTVRAGSRAQPEAVNPNEQGPALQAPVAAPVAADVVTAPEDMLEPTQQSSPTLPDVVLPPPAPSAR